MLAVLVAVVLPGASFACTSMAVGRDASSTGFPIVSHSDDSGPSAFDFRFIRVPKKTWPVGSMRPLHDFAPGYPRVVNAERSPEYAPVNGQEESIAIGHIPQVATTFGYWDTDYGVQNEVGLSIGESTCNARTVGWPATADKPYGYNRAGIEDLSKIAMERCETARCAVQVMGDIAVKMGFYSADSGSPDAPAYGGSSECLNIADAIPGDVWVFNVMTGKGNASAIWAAQRIPSDHISPIGNAFTIRKMKLNDSENYLYSPGVTDLAVENGWWSPIEEASVDTFDFFGAYGYTAADNGQPSNMRTIAEFYSGRRMWRVWNLLSPEESMKIDPNKGHLPKTNDPYPISLRAPKGSVTPKMVMDVHRDHYEGTQYDLTKGMSAGPHGSPNRYKTEVGVAGQWERAISMYRTSWSHVVEAKPHGRGVTWFGLDAPHGSTYFPFYGAATEGAPEPWHSHTGHMSKFDTNTAWWVFQLLNQYSDLNFKLINKDVRAKADKTELDAMANISSWEQDVAGLPEAAAVAELTKRSNAFAEAQLAQWWEFSGHIFAKFGRYVETYNESADNGEDGNAQAYPAWWLSNPEVGFTVWSRDGPYTGVQGAQGIVKVGEPFWMDWGASPIGAIFALVAIAAVAHELGMRRGLRKGTNMDGDVYFAQP